MYRDTAVAVNHLPLHQVLDQLRPVNTGTQKWTQNNCELQLRQWKRRTEDGKRQQDGKKSEHV
jgi:hypothetical protein